MYKKKHYIIDYIKNMHTYNNHKKTKQTSRNTTIMILKYHNILIYIELLLMLIINKDNEYLDTRI